MPRHDTYDSRRIDTSGIRSGQYSQYPDFMEIPKKYLMQFNSFLRCAFCQTNLVHSKHYIRYYYMSEEIYLAHITILYTKLCLWRCTRNDIIDALLPFIADDICYFVIVASPIHISVCLENGLECSERITSVCGRRLKGSESQFT